MEMKLECLSSTEVNETKAKKPVSRKLQQHTEQFLHYKWEFSIIFLGPCKKEIVKRIYRERKLSIFSSQNIIL